MRNKKLFIDLDNCLVESKYVDSFFNVDEAKAIANTENFQFTLTDGHGYSISVESYISFLRPHARKFVEKCEKLFGADNVKILTQSISSYSQPICKTLFNINPERVISRSDIYAQTHVYEDFECVLVDNLPVEDSLSSDKMKFLGLGAKYIQIEEYDINSYTTHEDHEKEFERVYAELEQWKELIPQSNTALSDDREN